MEKPWRTTYHFTRRNDNLVREVVKIVHGWVKTVREVVNKVGPRGVRENIPTWRNDLLYAKVFPSLLPSLEYIGGVEEAATSAVKKAARKPPASRRRKSSTTEHHEKEKKVGFHFYFISVARNCAKMCNLRKAKMHQSGRVSIFIGFYGKNVDFGQVVARICLKFHTKMQRTMQKWRLKKGCCHKL